MAQMRKGRSYKAQLIGGPFAGSTVDLSDPSGTLCFTAKGRTGKYVAGSMANSASNKITLHWQDL